MNEKDMLTALGPLAALMQDASATEIMVDAPDSVYVERRGKLEAANVKFDSPEAIRAVIDAVFALGGVTLGPGKTGHEIRLPGASRFAAAIPPTAVNGPCITIRKFFKTPLTMEKLFEFNAISREAHALLQSAIRTRMNLLVAGGTSSGKTTFLNLLTGDIPADERVIVVEEAFEYQPRSPRVVRLAADNSPDLKFADLISLAARMRPDRLIFGEAHGPEVMRMLDLMSTGYDGSFMNMHAVSAEDALERLEAACLMANLGLGLTEIRRLIASTVNVIAVLHRLPSGSRKVTQIAELRGLENDRYVLQPLVRYNAETDTFEMMGVRASWERA